MRNSTKTEVNGGGGGRDHNKEENKCPKGEMRCLALKWERLEE